MTIYKNRMTTRTTTIKDHSLKIGPLERSSRQAAQPALSQQSRKTCQDLRPTSSRYFQRSHRGSSQTSH